MCGINGIALNNDERVDEGLLVAMRDVLVHRGPDANGLFLDKNIGLAHTRLSIVDVEHGAQPMRSNQLSLVFNGEVYNHFDHRREFEADGYQYKTTSDTETVLQLYEKYGKDCLEKLRGMFAFAVWDENEKELFVARDRLGVKPLYYVHKEDGSFYFASEIKALVRSGAIKPELNYDVLPDQLANHGTSYDETLYSDVKRLMPGHFLVWKDGQISVKRYWDFSFEPKLEGNEEEFVEEWLMEFKNSVEMRLMADVPLGMFLSGGIDSSAICAVMSEMVDKPIKTFSVGFKEREANEFEYARIVSEAYKTEHYEITITPDQFFEKLPELIYHEDEPLGFVASVPLYFVSELAAKHVKVVLTGEGSDEMMAGYSRYYKALKLLEYGSKYSSMTSKSLRDLVKSGVSALPSGLNRKLKRTFLTRESSIEELLFDNFAIFPREMQANLLSDESKRRISDHDPYQHQKRWFEENDARDLLDKVLYTDSKTYLHELLMKQDQMSMAASLESRVPFLDHKLVELTSRMPESMKLRGKTTKHLLRESMRGILPDVILDRPKMGFPVPIGKWLRKEYRHVTEELVLSERALSRGVFNPDAVRKLAKEHFEGVDHGTRMLFLLNLEIWFRQAVEGERVEIRESAYA